MAHKQHKTPITAEARAILRGTVKPIQSEWPEPGRIGPELSPVQPFRASWFALADGSVCEGPACAGVPAYEVRVIQAQVEIRLWR